MNMKKKRRFRILSFLFGLLIFSMPILFAGCGGYSLKGIDRSQLSLGGVKVLSRPTDYSFKEAVGEFSENYYNIFARYILQILYNIYEFEDLDGVPTEVKTGLDTEHCKTYTSSDLGDDKYYLYDSLRYTITNVIENQDDGGYFENQVVKFDMSSAWNWAVPYDAQQVNTKNRAILFKNITSTDTHFVDGGESSITLTTKWTQQIGDSTIPSFPEVYTATDGEVKIIGSQQTNYFKSPYYQSIVEGETITTENYFQDALEYAIYMIVMGYEFEVDNGTILNTKDFDFFDFEIIKDGTTGKITNIKVGGWGNSKIKITDALKKAKDRYEEVGNYVGIIGENDEGLPNNVDDIKDFIKYFVIGKNALAKNTFDVTFTTKKEGEDDVETSMSFNRNYDKIITNIVKYACSKAPIGKNGDEKVTLEGNYTFSKISDFSGDYFFLNYEDENGNDTDEDLFARVEAAEYQSFVIFPLEQDFEKTLTYISLAFEYKDYGIEGLAPDDEIAINIGIRYFDCEANGGAGQITEVAPTRKVIKNGDLYAQEFEGQNWFYISTSDEGMSDEDDYIVVPEILKLREFNNDIGGGAINPNVSGTDENLSSIYISGAGSTKDYYKMNKSSSYGYFATLNEKMFSKNNAGDDACNFIEIYFDIEKNKAKTGVSYNFKTGLVLTYADDEN